MKNLDFTYVSAQNFLCFGKEGIELDLTNYGNVVLIRGHNKDRQEDNKKIASNGSGKCFGKNTPILMYDGTVKKVQDIVVGDLVMGNDSTPRKVLCLTRGHEELFKVIPKKGDSYVVNKSHILTLKSSDKKYNRMKNNPYKQGDVYNISVENYLQQTKSFKHLVRGYRAGVKFSYKPVNVDPYFLGIWLGDGHSHMVAITSQSPEILKHVADIAANRKLKLTSRRKNGCYSYFLTSHIRDKKTVGKEAILAYQLKEKGYSLQDISKLLPDVCTLYNKKTIRKSTVYRWIKYVEKLYGKNAMHINVPKTITPSQMTNAQYRNSLLNDFNDYNLINNKHVPFDYKTNTREIRLQVLAGLLDTDGHLDSNCFEFVNKNQQLAEDVVFLTRSLGMAAYIKKVTKKCQTGYCGVYWRVNISGNIDEIPTRVPYKQATKRRIKKDPLMVGIRLEEMGVGDYFGFSISGNQLFLLGDFTVVHNSSIPEIFVYTLFGETIKNRKKITHKNVINNKVKKGLRTEIRWGNYRVVRTRKPDSLRIWETENGDWSKLGSEKWEKAHEISLGGIPATQKMVEEKLGFNYETFINVVVFTDNNAGSFLELDAANKREIVENLLSLDKFREYYDIAKKERNNIKNNIKLQSEAYQYLSKAVEDAESHVLQLAQREKQWKIEKQAELKRLEQLIATKTKELATSDTGAALAKYYKSQDKIEQLNKQSTEIIEKDAKIKEIISKARDELETHRNTADQLAINIGQYNQDIIEYQACIRKNTALTASLGNLHEGTRCPTCFGIVHKDNYNEVLIKAQEEMDGCNQELIKFDTAKRELQKEYDSISKIIVKRKEAIKLGESKSASLSGQLIEIRREIGQLSRIPKPESDTHDKLIEQQLNKLKDEANAKTNEIEGPSPFIDLLSLAKEEVEIKNKELSNKKQEVDTLEKQLPYYEFFVDAFSEDGIRKFVIAGILPALNSRIAYWLQFLIDSRICLYFNNQFDEIIERNPPDGDPFVYHAMSGGERRMLNLSVSQAFAYIMMLNTGASPSCAFLDEVTTNIDQIGVQGVYNMIMELAKEKQVFVTTHDHDLLEMLNGCDTIELEKKDGFTRLI